MSPDDNQRDLPGLFHQPRLGTVTPLTPNGKLNTVSMSQKANEGHSCRSRSHFWLNRNAIPARHFLATTKRLAGKCCNDTKLLTYLALQLSGVAQTAPNLAHDT